MARTDVRPAVLGFLRAGEGGLFVVLFFLRTAPECNTMASSRAFLVTFVAGQLLTSPCFLTV